MELKLTVTDSPPNPAQWSDILKPQLSATEAQAGRAEEYRPLVIAVSEAAGNTILGGLWASTSFAHLRIDLVFIPISLRGHGYGRRIVTEAEQEAVRRGCRGAWLDTYSFQSRAFWERLGYTVFGTIEDYPPGHSRLFMRKLLAAPV